jgi:pimeloyl-ACP methyl ester carboxylesterase
MVRWQEYVDEKVRNARGKYRNIFLVGHSMGSLLAVHTALKDPENIRGLFLTAIPLVIRVTYSYFQNQMTIAFRKEHELESPVVSAARRLRSVSAVNPLEYLGGIGRLAELLRKSSEVRGRIGSLQLPVVVVHSENDEIVSGRSLNYVNGMQNVRIMIAEKSGHFYYAREVKDKMAAELTRFIVRETGEETVRE